jgi:ribosome modulation factor
MYISWRRRRDRLEATLVEGYRDAMGKPRSRSVCYLGSFPISDERAMFLAKANDRLDSVDHKLSAEQRLVLDAAIARKMRQPIERHGEKLRRRRMVDRSGVAAGLTSTICAPTKR